MPEASVDDGRRMDEAKLREKLSKIEALFAGAATEGERVAAGEARRRIQQRLQAASTKLVTMALQNPRALIVCRICMTSFPSGTSRK
jgi:hypothetical protein